MRIRLVVLILISCILWIFTFGWCDELNIVSNKMEAFENEGLVVFTGDVIATKKNFKLSCDKMYVYYATDANGKKHIKKIIALGRVIIETKKWKAYADRAVYFKDQEKLVLEKNPKIWYGENLVEGDRVIIYFDQDKSEILAENRGRVRAEFLLR